MNISYSVFMEQTTNVEPLEHILSRRAYKWMDDQNATHCHCCNRGFSYFTRKHHCRFCGKIFCIKCIVQNANIS